VGDRDDTLVAECRVNGMQAERLDTVPTMVDRLLRAPGGWCERPGFDPAEDEGPRR